MYLYFSCYARFQTEPIKPIQLRRSLNKPKTISHTKNCTAYEIRFISKARFACTSCTIHRLFLRNNFRNSCAFGTKLENCIMLTWRSNNGEHAHFETTFILKTMFVWDFKYIMQAWEWVNLCMPALRYQNINEVNRRIPILEAFEDRFNP